MFTQQEAVNVLLCLRVAISLTAVSLYFCFGTLFVGKQFQIWLFSKLLPVRNACYLLFNILSSRHIWVENIVTNIHIWLLGICRATETIFVSVNKIYLQRIYPMGALAGFSGSQTFLCFPPSASPTSVLQDSASVRQSPSVKYHMLIIMLMMLMLIICYVQDHPSSFKPRFSCRTFPILLFSHQVSPNYKINSLQNWEYFSSKARLFLCQSVDIYLSK